MSDSFAKVRRAYEVGRLRAALPWGLAPALLAWVSCASSCARREVVVAGAVLLGAALVGLVWRGGAAGAAARVGLVGGVFAWMVPVACPVPVACVGAGFVAGLVVGALARSRSAGRLEFVLVASAVAGVTGALGCVLVGLGSAAAMGLSLALGAVPMALVPRRA